MRKSNWTPSIVGRDDQDAYLVVDDLGRLGRVWCEADVEAADFETVVMDLLDGQYKNPIGIFAFNPAEGWSRDVSENVALELRLRCDLQLRDVPSSIQDFVGRHEGSSRQLTLRLLKRAVPAPLNIADWPSRKRTARRLNCFIRSPTKLIRAC
jgi:hypothetical protein